MNEKRVIYFVFFVSIFWGVFGCSKSKTTYVPYSSPSWISEYTDEASGTVSVFRKYQIQKAQEAYQKAYLQLIQKVGTGEFNKLSNKEQQEIFKEYLEASKRYQEIVKKIREHERQGREKCFSIMRSLVSAVLMYDKLSNKKMFKFDPEKLISLNIIKEIPKCPRDGTYGILYKDGRRTFFCTVHGTLKQK